MSWTKQATYLSQAYAIARANPRIDMMIWFLMKDEAQDRKRLAIGPLHGHRAP